MLALQVSKGQRADRPQCRQTAAGNLKEQQTRASVTKKRTQDFLNANGTEDI